MIEARYTFPDGFQWGTATSSHQVEGDNENNDWWMWEQEPDRILHGHRSGKACNWWGGLWQEDFDRAVETGQNAHRFSLEWSRIEPTPAVWDEAALEVYREMVAGAIERGLKPMVTLNHFSLPIWVSERGGWLAEEIPSWFERFVRKVVKTFVDFEINWITINEPNVLLFESYGSGRFPPGETNIRNWPKVIKHMLQAHAKAYHAIHEIQKEAQVGISHHFRGFLPRNPKNPFDRVSAGLRDTHFNDLFPRAATDGKVRLFHWRFSVPEAARTQDFIGLNYYTSEASTFNPLRPRTLFEEGAIPESFEKSPSGLIGNDPEGFFHALRWAHQYQLPIYVTENGIEDADDLLRPQYLVEHLHKLWKAVSFNWKIKGYFHWSLVDNFEWERGWTQRWGLWELDTANQARKKRTSADLYMEVCRRNSVSSEMVSRYAPNSFSKLYPPKGPAELFDGS